MRIRVKVKQSTNQTSIFFGVFVNDILSRNIVFFATKSMTQLNDGPLNFIREKEGIAIDFQTQI